MKGLIALCIALLPLCLYAGTENELIAKDRYGLVVEIKEKYGGAVIDTCTVVMYHGNQFVVVHRSGTTSWYPAEFHSVKVLRYLNKEGTAFSSGEASGAAD